MRTPLRIGMTIGVFIAALVALFVNCSDKSSGPSEEPGLPTAKASGYVYQSTTQVSAGGSANGVIVVDSANHAPAGYDPVSGASVIVKDLTGEIIDQVNTDGTGLFSLDSLPSGLARLEVRASPGAGSPDTTISITGLAGVTVGVGATFPVSREQASQIGLNGLPCQAMLLCTMQPLPPGVAVYPVFESSSSPDAHTTQGAEWLVVVDSAVNARFEHPVQYIFVNATTGAVVARVNAQSMPSINGIGLWNSDFSYFVYGGTDWSDIEDVEDIVVTTATSSVEVVRYKTCASQVAAPSASPIPEGLLKELESESPDDIFTLNICGGNRSDFFADFVHMRDFFVTIAPAANRGEVFWPHKASAEGLDAYDAVFRPLRDRISNRVKAGGKPTFIVFITAHGADGTISADFSDGKSASYSPAFLLLHTTEACKFRLIVCSCHSELFVDAMRTKVLEVPVSSRPDFVGYASCKSDELAYGVLVPDQVDNATRKTGSYFASAALPHMGIVSDDLSGLRKQDGSLLDDLTSFDTPDGKGQHPVVKSSVGTPSWCAAPLGSLISITNPGVNYTHINNVLECRDSMTAFGLANGDTSTITWSWGKDTDYLDLSKRNGQLAPGETTSVTAYYVCGAETTFAHTITINGERLNGTRSGTASFLANVTLDPGSKSQEFTLTTVAPLAGRTYHIYNPLIGDSEIDSSKLEVIATGQSIPANPWPSCAGTTFMIAYEGINLQDTASYGVRLELNNNSLDQCAGAPIPCRYTTWYSRPR